MKAEEEIFFGRGKDACFYIFVGLSKLELTISLFL